MIAATLAPLVIPSRIPPEALQMAQWFFVTCVTVALGIPVIRIIGRRFDRPVPPPPPTPAVSPDVTARLQRIEQAVEAVAIEVERIAEAQRFSTRLLAEQAQRSLPRPEGAP
jgi:hypothetical protein